MICKKSNSHNKVEKTTELYPFYKNGRLFNFGLLYIVLFSAIAMATQPAAAACPDVNYLSELDSISTGLPVIYFCKQTNVTDAELTYVPKENELVAGGSQVISMDDKSSIQTFPNGNSVNLAGFTPTNLNLNQLSAKFPNANGDYLKESLFNFYYVKGLVLGCSGSGYDRNEEVRNYLINNADYIFRANNGLKRAHAIVPSNGTELAVIEGVRIKHSNPTKTSYLTGDITFYQTNAGTGTQYFDGVFSKFCWVGVGAKMDINMNGSATSGLLDSGTYEVDVDVYQR